MGSGEFAPVCWSIRENPNTVLSAASLPMPVSQRRVPLCRS